MEALRIKRSTEGVPDVRLLKTRPNSIAGIDAKAAFPTAPSIANRKTVQCCKACPATHFIGLDRQVLYLYGMENSLIVITVSKLYRISRKWVVTFTKSADCNGIVMISSYAQLLADLLQQI